MAVEIKICGVTRPEDAALAAHLGVSRIGVVFAWGPRVVDQGQARAVVTAAAGVPVLGVVSGGSASAYLALAAATGLSGLQLHGDSTPALAEALRVAGLEVWRVAALTAPEAVEREVAEASTHADLVLLEPHTPGRSGGLGLALDHDLARVARRHLVGRRCGLAGGLTPETVGAAIRLVSPDLVDVSSGVESTPGVKDPARLRHFVEAVRDVRTPG